MDSKHLCFFLQDQIVIILGLTNHSNSVTITQLCSLEGKHPETMFKQMSGRLALINFTKNRQQATVRIGIADFSPGQDNKKGKKGKIKQKNGVSNSNILYMTKIF